MLHRRTLAKKGIHGISILLIFLVVIVLSVGISALIINYSQALAADGQVTYQEVHNNYKAFQVLEVAGFDGRDQNLTRLTIDAKMFGDSTPIDMHHLSLIIGEEDFRTVLVYRGDEAPIVNNNSGYNTWAEQEFDELAAGQDYLIDADLDDDGQNDYLRVNATYAIIDISGLDHVLSSPLGDDLSAPPATISGEFPLIDGEERYGTLTLDGITTDANEIPASATVTLRPYHVGSGYYVAEHLIRSERSRNGYIISGDLVRFHIETYQAVTPDDILSIRFLYRNMDAVSKDIYVGNTFPSLEKVVLFPKP